MKDIFCSYYTDSADITNYMVKTLGVDDADVILEPSAGEGIFIDSILETERKVQIDALDINDEAVSVLLKKYEGNDKVAVRKTDTLFDQTLDSYDISYLWVKQTDTLLDQQLDLYSIVDGHYSKVIGNPPYGAWQEYEKRDLLKRKYPGQYVKETYSLFLLRCISVLKMHGRLSFIIPDTFMFLNMHKKLREILLRRTKIEEVLIFPSKFFPGVSFGYSNLSIITLERCTPEEALSNVVRVIKGFNSSAEFEAVLEKHYPAHLEIHNLVQKDILQMPEYRFVLSDENDSSMIAGGEKKLGDVADIVTGFYCGDNKRFIRAKDDSVKGSKGYETIDLSLIKECQSLEGIAGSKEGYIPFVKGSSKQRYIRQQDDWYIRWDEETIKLYNSNKKSRFQNSAYYFKKGIAIPMVKSSVINATIMDGKVFDQSIVGIFPRDPDNTLYVLALMNSDTVNKLIHVINPTANNSANYVKLIPYVEPEAEEKAEIVALVKRIMDLINLNKVDEANEIHTEINNRIAAIYSRNSA